MIFGYYSHTMEIIKALSPQFKSSYVRLIAQGHVESTALSLLQVDWIDFFEVCAKDPEFRSDIELARNKRADKWVDDIALSTTKTYFETVENVEIERAPTKEEIARDKLLFEQRKFLAMADNPAKYAQGKATKVDVNIDMTDFKLLTPQESMQILNSDPFNKMVTIDAESNPVKDVSNE